MLFGLVMLLTKYGGESYASLLRSSHRSNLRGAAQYGLSWADHPQPMTLISLELDIGLMAPNRGGAPSPPTMTQWRLGMMKDGI